MRISYKKIAAVLIVSIAVTAAMLLLPDEFKVSSDRMGMLYTIVSVVFSVCMGVACSLNLSKVKNNEFYCTLKDSCLAVRDTSICLFVAATFLWLASESVRQYWVIVFSYSFNLLTLFYFVVNFRILQNLNYEIEDRSRGL